MTVLSATQIRERLAHSDPEFRLVVTPILDPATQLKSNQTSIDIRLGRAFTLPRSWRGTSIDDVHDLTLTGPMFESVVLDYGQPIIIHPHQFILARTLEMIRLPTDLMAYVIGRSSWGRRGLTVATAIAVHPGFAGSVILELKNIGEAPLLLYTFDCVAQLIFHRVGITHVSVSETTDSTGSMASRSVASAASTSSEEIAGATLGGGSQYSFTFIPRVGQARDEGTKRRIEALRERRRRR